MRGSIVVLALAISPFVTHVARAQDGRPDAQRDSKWSWSWFWRDRDEDKKRGHDQDKKRGHDEDNKCEERRRGNPSDNGREHRADPREKGHKNCAPAPSPEPAPAPAPDPTPDPVPEPTPDPVPVVGHVTISGSLFHDLSQNGVFDEDEIGLAGWTVMLSGPVMQTVLSDGNGSYSFPGIVAGSYTVCVSPPMGWRQTLPMSGVACPNNSFGYTVTAPDIGVDVSITDINFGFLSIQ